MTREFWEGLAGATVCGKYPLRRLIGSTGRSAVYLTSLGSTGQDAVLKLALPFDGPLEIPRIAHARILPLFDTGTCEVGHSYLRYFVTEAADGNLATAVSNRPLSPGETCMMLGPVLEALEYLHSHGMAHGGISLNNILTVGESFKLSVDSIRPQGSVASPSKDMRALGLGIIEVLTQARQPSLIASLPKPFQEIVEGSLRMDPALQWTARSAAEYLSRPAVNTTPAQATPVSRPVAAVKQIGVYAVAALLLLAAFVSVAVHETGARPGVPAPVRNSSVEIPPRPAPSIPPVATIVKPVEGEPHEGQGHVVVVGSFSRPENALHEVDLIAQRWPEFNPRVSPPSAVNSYYLVIIGSDLSAESAQSLRQRAVASGLPPDIYITTYRPSQP